jgi:hypothetical protein
MGADQRTFCTKHGQQGDYYSKCGYCVAEDEHAKVVELTALVQKLSGGNVTDLDGKAVEVVVMPVAVRDRINARLQAAEELIGQLRALLAPGTEGHDGG